MKRSLPVSLFVVALLVVSVGVALAAGVWTKGITPVYELPSTALPAYDASDTALAIPAMVEVTVSDTKGDFVQLGASPAYTATVVGKWVAIADLTSVKPAPVKAKELETKLKGLQAGTTSVWDFITYLQQFWTPAAAPAPASAPAAAPAAAAPASAPAVAPAQAQPAAPAASALTEVMCDDKWLVGLFDSKATPTGKIPPGNGIVVTMDPGSVIAGGQTVKSDKGMLVAFYNAGTKDVVATIATGWNEVNGRWNIHACLFAGTQADLNVRAADWQTRERKPFYQEVAVK